MDPIFQLKLNSPERKNKLKSKSKPNASPLDRIYITRGLKRTRFSLPLLVKWEQKWHAGVALFFVSALLYCLANRLQFSAPRKLSLTSMDTQIPFLPWTIWIYLSVFIYIPFVYYINRCIVSLNKHLYSFFALICTSCLIFMIWPVAYPRELYTIPHFTGTSWISSEMVLQWTRAFDLPVNTCPSLHVSAAYLIAFGFLEDLQGYLPLVLTWSTLLTISTLTTKQHAILDVLSGFALAVLFHILFHRVFFYRLPLKTSRKAQGL